MLNPSTTIEMSPAEIGGAMRLIRANNMDALGIVANRHNVTVDVLVSWVRAEHEKRITPAPDWLKLPNVDLAKERQKADAEHAIRQQKRIDALSMQDCLAMAASSRDQAERLEVRYGIGRRPSWVSGEIGILIQQAALYDCLAAQKGGVA